MDVGNAIKLLGEREDIPQRELSNLCGISVNILYRIKSGGTFPSRSTTAKTCNTLKIPESYLLLLNISEGSVPENKRILYKTLREPIREDLIQNP